MIETRRIGADDWREYREIRLAALAEAPYAFGSTFADVSKQDESDFRGRLGQDRAATFLAYPAGAPDAGSAVGVAGGFFDDEMGPNEVHLVAMWVGPEGRGAGTGRALVDAVVAWARSEGADAVHLWVTETNDPARRLYERCGFAYNGERGPLPSDPALDEVAMTLTVSGSPSY